MRLDWRMSMLYEVIDRDMAFYTFNDFIRLRKHIKDRLAEKDREYIMIYRMYVESRPWVKDFYRGCIWDYLNDYMTDEELLGRYDEYLVKCGDKQ